jgi:hypothetical protein
MMEHFFYLTVKGLAVIYILYKTFRFLFGKQRQSLWHFLTPKVQDKKEMAASQAKPPEKPEAEPYSIVGKSQTVYLDEPLKVETSGKETSEFVVSETTVTDQSLSVEPVEPAFSEDLQPVPAFEEEPDIFTDEIEDNLEEEPLTDEDRFMPLEIDASGETVSTGKTYDEISCMLGAVQGKKMSEADRQAAASALHDIQGSELYDLLLMQAENEAVIERLLKENLDSTGEKPAETGEKKRTQTADFDMDKYV